MNRIYIAGIISPGSNPYYWDVALVRRMPSNSHNISEQSLFPFCNRRPQYEPQSGLPPISDGGYPEHSRCFRWREICKFFSSGKCLLRGSSSSGITPLYCFPMKLGQWIFNRLRVGIAPANAAFPQPVTLMLSKKQWKEILWFLDDLSISCMTFEQGRKLLQNAFDCITEANVRLEPT